MHADYYDGVRRQKGLKELLGQIDRFRTMTEGLYDVFARGYGARLLVATLERHRLAPRALAGQADREVLAKQLDWAGAAYARLRAPAHADIEHFERAHALYHWLKDADPERTLRNVRREPESLPQSAVRPPAAPRRGLGTFAILLATTLVWTALLAMVCVLSVAENDPPPGGYVGFVCALDGFPVIVTLTVFLLAYRRYRRAMVQYAADRQAYQAARSHALKETREARSRLQADNDAIDKVIPDVRRDHAAALAALREALNEFIAAHPQLPTFVSPV